MLENMKKNKSFLILLVLLFSYTVFSQNKKNKVIIRLVDSVQTPVPNASIFLDGEKYSKKSNSNGKVTIKYKNKPKIISIYAPKLDIVEVDYKGQKKLTIQYDVIIKSKVIKKPRFLKDKRDYRNIYDYLRARVSGVNVSSDNIVTIRGTGSFNGSTQPLFILNGSPVSGIQDLNPFDVKTVTVLKGPEAAYYGVRGSNGVIIIKTK
jgi:TonB-dependent SusC/RagA subfamily outer membrane receptor